MSERILKLVNKHWMLVGNVLYFSVFVPLGMLIFYGLTKY